MRPFIRVSRLSSALPLLALLLLALVPVLGTALDQPFYITFFTRVIVFTIAASALNLALGYAGLVSFGHALFLGIGAYSVALPTVSGHDSALMHLAIAVAVGGITAFVTGLISLRTSGIGFIMITLAFGQMGYFLMVSLKQYGGDEGLPIPGASSAFAVSLGHPLVLYVVCFVILAALTLWLGRLRHAPFGMVLRGASTTPGASMRWVFPHYVIN